ncbi:hypothetical protein DFP72DRAFT_1079563 [Ephemerocybe angulata]|nr:hypothetical protein DFP72DRAFT_1079563 [Tulosesus angulatus]
MNPSAKGIYSFTAKVDADEAQYTCNWLSSRLRAATRRFIEIYDEEQDEAMKAFRDHLWAEILFAHTSIGLLTLRFPTHVVLPELYKRITLLAFRCPYTLDEFTVENLAPIAALNSLHDPCISLYSQDWWNYPLARLSGIMGANVNYTNVAYGWRDQLKLFPFRPPRAPAEVLSIAANIDLLALKELQDFRAGVAMAEASLEEEQKLTREALRTIWLDLQRCEALRDSLSNAGIESPILDLSPPPA